MQTDLNRGKEMNRKFLTASLLTVLFVLTGHISAQTRYNYNNDSRVVNAQARIRDQIIREQGGTNARVTFNNDGQFENEAYGQLRMRGSGLYYRSGYGNGRSFSYDALYDRNGNVRVLNYQFSDGPGRNPGPFPPGRGDDRPGRGDGWGRGWGGNRPNGTARYSGALVNFGSNKCLDISDYGNSSDGTRIQQWSCAGQPNQVFDLISTGRNEFAIYNRQTRKVFDIPDNQVYQDGAELQQYSWSGRANQRFRMVQSGGGGFRLVNVASGKCLDVEGQSGGDGAKIHQWDCGGQRSQVFRMR